VTRKCTVTNKQPDRERDTSEESGATRRSFYPLFHRRPSSISKRYQPSISSSSSAKAETAPRPLRLEARELPAAEAGLDDLEAGLVALVLEVGLVLDLRNRKIAKPNGECQDT
jgi:ribosomal protein L28